MGLRQFRNTKIALIKLMDDVKRGMGNTYYALPPIILAKRLILYLLSNS